MFFAPFKSLNISSSISVEFLLDILLKYWTTFYRVWKHNYFAVHHNSHVERSLLLSIKRCLDVAFHRGFIELFIYPPTEDVVWSLRWVFFWSRSCTMIHCDARTAKRRGGCSILSCLCCNPCRLLLMEELSWGFCLIPLGWVIFVQ